MTQFGLEYLDFCAGRPSSAYHLTNLPTLRVGNFFLIIIVIHPHYIYKKIKHYSKRKSPTIPLTRDNC